ncbi:transposase [Polaribacter ponticola]|uniref:Transposase n=1 Tax=Polaribacter ponticola TaxID=2978475 RepID=A0ABT5S8J9_9FLAO|nr:transposase [Polaribacter sp. MSW5]MDD7913536.1 transposase [Polaribacter sp. MSW5]MDD7914443.1 transposase [Polaribacter sp. MSW5]MDD7915178.1 transposase [Polaribacter sp. MSW5]
MSRLLDIAKLLLPEVLVDNFKLTKHEIKQDELHFYFTELNNVPIEYKAVKLSSKGFFPEATVQDFPIRGKNVYLHIIRRRWLNESTKKVITRDWQLVAKGTRITSEFATFLKDIS